MLTEVFFQIIQSIVDFFFNRSEKQQIKRELTPNLKMRELFTDFGGRWKLVNILGIRNDSNPGKWNDLIIVCINDKIGVFEATVDPSRYFTFNPLVPEGCAHLPLRYYENFWIFGLHRGKYEAFVHRGKKIRVWRDSNKNFIEDDNERIFYKKSGCNFHHGYSTKGNIGVHSALCQVIKSKEEFNDVLENAKQTEQTSFDYLLIKDSSLPSELKKLKKGKWHYSHK